MEAAAWAALPWAKTLDAGDWQALGAWATVVVTLGGLGFVACQNPTDEP